MDKEDKKMTDNPPRYYPLDFLADKATKFIGLQ